MHGFGFHDVTVSGSGRDRIAEGAWLQDDAMITVKMIPGKIDVSESQFPLATLLAQWAMLKNCSRRSDFLKRIDQREYKGAAQRT